MAAGRWDGELNDTGTFKHRAAGWIREGMRIRFQDGTAREYDGGPATASDVLAAIGLNPSAVIVSRDGKVIPEDATLGRDDEIRVIRVSHGG